MSFGVIKRALISVTDKTGIVEFAQVLESEFGVEIISTGGTARVLKESRDDGRSRENTSSSGTWRAFMSSR